MRDTKATRVVLLVLLMVLGFVLLEWGRKRLGQLVILLIVSAIALVIPLVEWLFSRPKK